MNKSIVSLGVSLMLLASGCSDNYEPFQTNPSTEEAENGRVSYFDIDPVLIIIESTENIGYANLKSGFFSLSTHNVDLKRNANGYRCGIFLHESKNLEDGIYLMTFSDTDNQPIEGKIKITVKDNKVIEIGEAKSTFSLRHGSGTQSDPYIIGSARDFLTFLDDLRENELTNGRDVWFKQTADIDLMDQSSTKPGRGYFGYSFAGHYDGGGYALKGLYYRGAESPDLDTRIGIFPSLLDGATVNSLTISGVNVSTTYADTGTLAGTVVGTVSVAGIKMTGSVASDKAANVGGFIGRMEKGRFTASDMRLCGTVGGYRNVGGIIGSVSEGQADFYRISTSDSHYYVEGHESIGGVIGSVNDCTVRVKDSELQHVVSKEDADIRLIRTTGGAATGGIIGSLSGSKPVELTNNTIACPVGGLNRTGDKVGGIIGSISASGEITLKGCRVTSIVSGSYEVGGYIGYCNISGNGKLKIEGDSKVNYIIPDDSAAGVEGVSQVGGAIGLLSKSSIAPASQAKIRIGINVDADKDGCGGAIGKITDSTVDLSVFDMTSATMQVSGGSHVGGMIGYAVKSTVNGPATFNFDMEDTQAVVPSEDRFTPLFTGIVKGTYDVGGIVGRGDDVTLKGLSAKCTVTGTSGSGFGGIIGSVYTNSASHLEDLTSGSLVTAKNSPRVGGIIGYLCDNYYTYATDCINYGEVTGQEDVGGIIGYLYKCGDEDNYKESEIRWSVNEGTVSGGECVGGVVGKSNTTTKSEFGYINVLRIHHCGNHGEINSPSASHAESGVGGIVGYGGGWQRLDACANSGLIVSEGPHKGVGGIAGSLGQDAASITTHFKNVDVYSCFNSGTIDSKDGKTHVGGILGFMEEGPDAYIKNCANYGRVLNKHNSNNGGILGYVDHLGNIYNCVNVGIVDEGNATIGTHKSGSIFDHDGLYMIDGSGWTWPSATVIKKEDINNKEKYPKLDFKDTWMIPVEGPTLRDCPFK